MRDDAGFTTEDAPKEEPWTTGPDLSMLRLNRRAPPEFPLHVLGDQWQSWAANAAEAAACPPDYVAAPLLSAVSTLTGNARWVQVTPGWREPPHLWTGVVGDSGTGKSPGSDSMMRSVIPVLEQRMGVDFPDKLREWQAEHVAREAKRDAWKGKVKDAAKKGDNTPLPAEFEIDDPLPPQAPRLKQHDVTIERLASLLAASAPKGLMVIRDELVGWLLGLNAYNEAGRAFWIEAYGGRPYRVERQKLPQPIDIPHLAVAIFGGTQPDKLAELFNDGDDGLLARFCWFWPDPVPFHLGRNPPNASWAIEGLDRLRLLEMAQTERGLQPVYVPMADAALSDVEAFCQEMQGQQEDAAPLMRSALGKFRGLAPRLALTLEFLWWSAKGGFEPPPMTISRKAFLSAAHLVADYFLPMAERVYGDAAIPPDERNATTLARWIVKAKAAEVHIRYLQREVRLPGLRSADAIKDAANLLVEAGWLRVPRIVVGVQRKVAYGVNPELWNQLP